RQARADRVEHDVPTDLLQVSLSVHELSAIPPLEDVTGTLVPSIEPLCVHAVQLSHGGRQVALRRLEQQMVVVAHQTVRVTPDSIACHHGGQHDQERGAVGVVREDRLPIVAPRGNVIGPAGKKRPERSRHSSTLPSRPPSLQVSPVSYIPTPHATRGTTSRRPS